MIWVFALLLAALAFGSALLLKAPRKGWEAIATALALGIAGYGLQGHPGQPGAPKVAAEPVGGTGEALVAARQVLSGKGLPAGNQYLVIGDALARHGQFANAAGVLRGAVKKNPRDSEAWLALANALVGHGEGMLTPAALHAYRQAAAAAPDSPGPPFFLGLALAQSGQLTEGRGMWARLLAASPPDAPWRSDLARRLAALDAFIAQQGPGGGQP